MKFKRPVFVAIAFCAVWMITCLSQCQMVDRRDPVQEHEFEMEQAIEKGELQKIRILLRTPYIRANEPGSAGQRWLERACVFGDNETDVLKLLVDSGASVLDQKSTILNCARRPGKLRFVGLEAKREASIRRVPLGDYLNMNLLLSCGSVALKPHGPYDNIEQAEAAALAEVRVLVEIGMNPLLFIQNTPWEVR